MTAVTVLAALAWFTCGGLAFYIDQKDCPHTVDPVGDALLSSVLLLGGPAGLTAILLMRHKP